MVHSQNLPHTYSYTYPTIGTSPFDMTASVTSPNGVTELCDVVNLDDCHYSIKFVPKEMGIHTVSVKHKDMHIPGSPFQFTVGPIAGGGAHKVHAAGSGLVGGQVSSPSKYEVVSFLLTIRPLNKLTSAKFLIYFYCQSASMLLKVGEIVV